ncbi:MAG: LLM class flavin-dependent oxidoreductase [Nitrososphaerota archaeon]|nr:LLM class flavin-dependent oxidoreductase [Nitrososphaerota archaeon]
MIYDVEFNSAGQVPSAGILEAAKVADAKGFGTVWKGESNSRDPTAILPAIAAVTKRVRLGTAVIHIYARTPVETGIYSATMDELSGGRFTLGLGVANETLASWHGLEDGHPLKRAEEYIGIVRKVFAAEKLQVQGEYYSSSNFRMEFKPPNDHLQIILAALGPKMAQLAGRIADGAIINMADPGRISFVAENLGIGAKEAGRDPKRFEIVAKVRVSLNDDIEKAKDALKKVVTFYSLAHHYRDMLAEMGLGEEVKKIQETYKASGFKVAAKAVTDDMLSKIPVVPATTMRELKKGLQKYDKSGASRIIVAYVPSTAESTKETIEFIRSW